MLPLVLQRLPAYISRLALGIIHWTLLQCWKAAVKWTTATRCTTRPANIPAWVISPFQCISGFDAQYCSLPEKNILLTGLNTLMRKWNQRAKNEQTDETEEEGLWQMSVRNFSYRRWKLSGVKKNRKRIQEMFPFIHITYHNSQRFGPQPVQMNDSSSSSCSLAIFYNWA